MVFSSLSWSKISEIHKSSSQNKDSARGFKIYQEAKFTFVVFSAPPISSNGSYTYAFTPVPGPERAPNPFHFLCSETTPSFTLYTPAFELFNKYLPDLKSEFLKSEKPVIITGAGLGGSVASLFTLWILQTVDLRLPRPLCITFGSPFVGDARLQQTLENSVSNSCFLHVADAERTPITEGFKPFGTYLICNEIGCVCIEDPEAVMKLLKGVNSDLVEDYGVILHRLNQSVLSMVDSGLMSDDLIERMKERADKKVRFDPFKKLNDMNISMAKMVWYIKESRNIKIGYYDRYRLQIPTVGNIKVEAFKKELNGFWTSVVEDAKKKPQSDISILKRRFLSGNIYRRMIEPLDIAEYYRNGEKEYRTKGRSRHYVMLEKWFRNAWIEPFRCENRDLSDLLTFDSCFWAEVEEALVVINEMKTHEGMTDEVSIGKLVRFEEYVWEMIGKREVSPEIFLEKSSFMRWWKEYREIKGRDGFNSPSPFIDFMNTGMYQSYGLPLKNQISGSATGLNTFVDEEDEEESQKVVLLKLNLRNDEEKTKALSIIAKISGVSSADWNGYERISVTVYGKMDPVVIVEELRKDWMAEIISVGPSKKVNPKKESSKEQSEKQVEMSIKTKEIKEEKRVLSGDSGSRCFIATLTATALNMRNPSDDWSSFCEFLDTHQPPLNLSECKADDVIDFLRMQQASGDVEAIVDHLSTKCIKLKENPFRSLAVTRYVEGVTRESRCILVFFCNDSHDVDDSHFMKTILKELREREVTPLTYNISRRENLDTELLDRSRVGILVLSNNYACSSESLDHLVAIMEHWKANPVYFRVTLSNIELEDPFEAVQLQCLNPIQADRVQNWKEAMAEPSPSGFGRHHRPSSDATLFSSSLPVLPHGKLQLGDNIDGFPLIDDAAARPNKFHESLDDIESHSIGNLLPDEEDILTGMMDDLVFTELPDADDYDLFGSGGGMELDTDFRDGLSMSGPPRLSISSLGGNAVPQFNIQKGARTVAGEHPSGEHPSRTLFVRNINSNVEDSELKALFEQYGDIRTLYTACKRRGFVIISYYDIRAARMAMRSLQNKPLRRRKLDIHFSIPKDNPSEKDMNQGTLVVFNLDPSVSDDDLHGFFGAHGEIKEIRETPHKRHHKFVEFYDVRAAEAALKALNRTQVMLAEEVVRNACLRLDLKKCKNLAKILAYLKNSQPSGADIVGLWGMAGIGKTSIAREIYGVLAPEYDVCYFLEDFYLTREKKGLRKMRDDFFSKVFGKEKSSISACDIRPSFMSDWSHSKKILVVLDGVNYASDAEAVVGGFGWLSQGHRIIFTSRRKQVLVQCMVKEPYEIQRLCELESFRLCKLYLNDELEVISELMSCSSSIPLFLEVLGSDVAKLHRNDMKERLQLLRRDPPTPIREVFKRSFDGLDENEKNIFLDLACFFGGESKDHVVQLLDGCGFLTYLGICDLIDESLISILDNKIEIPIPFQDMGRFIVHKEDSGNPCKRSRLWDSKDIIDVFTKNSGTEEIEGIFLDASDLTCKLSSNVFGKMDSLRLLKLCCSTSENECKLTLLDGLDTLPDELRLLHWEHYPLDYLPQTFNPENLVEINMPYSDMEKLWEGKKNLEKLKIIKLSHSRKLTDILMLSEALNLEHIDLEGCTSLVDISTSIPGCGKLVSLNMKDCSDLRTLPRMVDLTSLKLLNLSGCTELEEIQDFAPNLEELYLAGTAIRELPLSVENLTELVTLDLKNCRRLQHLPIGIRSSRSIVELSGCTSLESLPKLEAVDYGTS
ncbi:uncharacterized protein LOC18029147 isoform X2 [Eutrema salsugineum]|uniref:uncharacterized protein LOC18029147 isoform X2 n=1 Tax=Eutrema salsugineum TaxID=72664 RepID=UPI000CED0A8C|nr:uncharacterized protein LOC18029147 isoform X2 [Eutrema salsugineum]